MEPLDQPQMVTIIEVRSYVIVLAASSHYLVSYDISDTLHQPTKSLRIAVNTSIMMICTTLLMCIAVYIAPNGPNN